MRIFIIIVASVLIFHLIWWWWAHRRLRPLRQATLWRTLLAVFMGGAGLYMAWMILSPQQAREAHAHLPQFLLAIVYLWYLLFLPIATAGLILGALVWLGWRPFARPRKQRVEPDDEMDQPLETAPSRRELLGAMAVATPIVLTTATAGFGVFQLRHFRVRRFQLAFANLPPELDGLTIAHLSDVHVGRFTRGEHLQRIVDATNQLRADLILLTGDLIDLSLSDLPAALEMVHRLDPRQGLLMCEGNHDLIEDREGFERGVKASGVPLLLDESKSLSIRGYPLQFLGVRWARDDAGKAAAMRRVAELHDPAVFSILLAHHPHVFDDAAAAGIPLTLAGHTHGGQLMLNERLGAGPVLFRYVSGRYQHGRSSLVVSNGVGNWFPLRTNAPAEIIHLTLHRASQSEIRNLKSEI